MGKSKGKEQKQAVALKFITDICAIKEEPSIFGRPVTVTSNLLEVVEAYERGDWVPAQWQRTREIDDPTARLKVWPDAKKKSFMRNALKAGCVLQPFVLFDLLTCPDKVRKSFQDGVSRVTAVHWHLKKAILAGVDAEKAFRERLKKITVALTEVTYVDQLHAINSYGTEMNGNIPLAAYDFGVSLLSRLYLEDPVTRALSREGEAYKQLLYGPSGFASLPETILQKFGVKKSQIMKGSYLNLRRECYALFLRWALGLCDHKAIDHDKYLRTNFRGKSAPFSPEVERVEDLLYTYLLDVGPEQAAHELKAFENWVTDASVTIKESFTSAKREFSHLWEAAVRNKELPANGMIILALHGEIYYRNRNVGSLDKRKDLHKHIFGHSNGGSTSVNIPKTDEEGNKVIKTVSCFQGGLPLFKTFQDGFNIQVDPDFGLTNKPLVRKSKTHLYTEGKHAGHVKDYKHNGDGITLGQPALDNLSLGARPIPQCDIPEGTYLDEKSSGGIRIKKG
jgi:hypothetical protein